MIASTLQLSLNRAKVSFLLRGSDEKFINLCRIVESLSYCNHENPAAGGEEGDGGESNGVMRDAIFVVIVQRNQ